MEERKTTGSKREREKKEELRLVIDTEMKAAGDYEKVREKNVDNGKTKQKEKKEKNCMNSSIIQAIECKRK